MKKETIEILVKKNLCYQCGTCSSICPTKAISMKRLETKGYIYPLVDDNNCINCGKCLKVCPINNINIEEKHIPSAEDFIGVYKSNEKNRFDFTASGGVVTEIINYLFERKKINKAIVTGMSKENPCDSQVYIIEDNKELKNISGSIYQPVSVNEALRDINNDDKVAFIGLPCHIRGLELFLKEKKLLQKSFIIKIGLICTIGRGKHGTTITLKKLFNVKNKEDVKMIRYRYGIPPGKMQIYFRDNTKKEVESLEFLKNTDFIFIPKGCLFCNDLFNDKADITVGDPWGLNKGKKAMVIVRNEKIKKILNEMVYKEYLEFDEELTVAQCLKTQNHCVNYKIHNYLSRINTYKKFNLSIPKIYNLRNEKNSFKENVGYILLAINSLIFNTKIGLKLIEILPRKLIYKYRDKVLAINTKKKRRKNDKKTF